MNNPQTELDIIRQAPEKDRLWLAHGAPYVVYGYALERGWITEAEHDEARRRSGSLWHYTGD